MPPRPDQPARPDRDCPTAGASGFLSRSYEVPHLDPLAVLETLSPCGPSAYLETPSRGVAFAAGEAVASWEGVGPGRFAEADDWLRGLSASLRHAGTAPRICARFPFHAGSESSGLPSRLFLPAWQVISTDRGTTVVLVETADERAEARLAARAERFRRFAYRPAGPAEPDAHPVLSEVGGSWFVSAVRRATELIREGAFEKVVLTRAFDWRRHRPFDAHATLHRLRSSNPACHAFLADTPQGSLVGSTPETLLAVADDALRTEAVAGTTRRGSTPSEDAALAAALLASDKDNREHNVVTASILRRLRLVGIEGEVADRPELLRLGKVMHLRTPVTARLPSPRRFLEVAGELHPTPAVGGKPRANALPYIPGFEPHDRGLYTGAVGWVGADGRSGELLVALRCAELSGNRARAYAGAGIVDGSDPAAEAAETEMKLRTILDSLA
jgi:menaquinone-specific isochorismate synthase